MSSSLLTAVQALRTDPRAILTEPCVLAFRAFLSGFKAPCRHMTPLFDAFTAAFEGPSGADACTRVYLAEADSRVAMTRALDTLAGLLESMELPAPAGARAPETFIEYVRGPIEQGRPAMALPEPSVTSLADFARGYLWGLRDVDAEVARYQEEELRRFEVWLRAHYQGSPAPWYGLIRVYEGACERGLVRFLDLWDDFTVATTARRGYRLPD